MLAEAAVGALISMLDSHWEDRLSPAERALLHAKAQTQLLSLREQQLADPIFNDDAARALLDQFSQRGCLSHLDSPNTTHLSVATSDGGLVAVTMSMGYGAGVTIPGVGTGLGFRVFHDG